MRVKIYYAGDKPCVQEVAIAIAAEAKQNSEPLPPAYMPESLALAFIGTVANGKKPDKRALDFVNMLDSKRISAVALFCTSHNLDGSCLDVLREALKARGIKAMDETLICHGKGGLMGGKMPTDEDLANAKKFADKCLDLVTNHVL